VATLVLVLIAFLRPDVVPTWVSSFVAPSVNGNAIRMRDKMNTRSSMMMNGNENNAMLGDTSMFDRDYMKNMMGESGVTDRRSMGQMMADGEMMGGQEMKKVMTDTGIMDVPAMKKVMKDNGMMGGHGIDQMMEDGGMIDQRYMEKVMADTGKMDRQAMKKMMEDNEMADYGNEASDMNLNSDMAQMHAEMNGKLSDNLQMSSDAATAMTTRKSVELDSGKCVWYRWRALLNRVFIGLVQMFGVASCIQLLDSLSMLLPVN
jgi:hypothetical protein